MIRKSIHTWNIRFGLGLPPSTGMREALQWLMLARLAVLYVVLSVIVLQQVFRRDLLSGYQLSLSYGLLALSFAFNLFHAMATAKLPTHWWLAATHILFDSLLISSWILLSGGRDTLFALLYLIQILIVSLILYQKGAWLTSILASTCFGVITVMNATGFHGHLWSWLAYSAIFLMVGVVGGYLSEELLRTTQSLKEKQEKLEKLTALHERIISNIPTGLLTVDRTMTVNFINPAGENILGIKAKDLVGKSLQDVEPGLVPYFAQIETEDVVEESKRSSEQAGAMGGALSVTGPEHHRSFFVQAKSEKGHMRLQQRVEIGKGENQRIIRGDVAELDAEAGLGNLLDQEASGGRVLLFQDVTKLAHLEEKVKQNEKLAAIGQLAAGIAHEIRNPLASMSASIELLKGSLPPGFSGDENHKLMEIAIREIDRLNRLISEFLDFVKPVKLRFENVDLRSLLTEVVSTIRRAKEFGEHIQVKESYETVVIAHAHSEKLKQVIWNLLVNAVQAMSKKGVIEVGCAKVGQEQVKFWVQDEGVGMSEEVISHLYEPFFTTKDKGTGLGLATAYKIVEAHHGEIKVSSKVDLGTKFEVFLPCA